MTDTAQAAGELEKQLARVREQQAAVAAVLRTMSTAPADLDAILDAILGAATRLCHAAQGYVYVLEGNLYQLTRTVGIDTEFGDWARDHPIPVGDPGKATSRAALLGRPLHIPDALADPNYTFTEAQRRGNFRAILCVPLMRDGVAVAVISMWRTVPEPFTEEEIALVSTFADQALIAFENVRLARETQQSLERQTALAEILKVISASPTDVQPVLDAIVESALRFCAAEDAGVMLPSGTHLHMSAHRGTIPVASDLRYPNDGTSVSSRAFLAARTIAVQDLQAEADLPAGAEHARAVGYHAIVGAPLLHAGAAIGVIVLRRFDARAFSEREIGDLETFAAQAVIAIENVRLFNETRESLERQTAVSEILSVMSRSPDDLQPIIDVIAASARRYCGAEDAMIIIAERGQITASAHDGPVGFLPGTGPVDQGLPATRAILDGRTIHVEDIQTTELEEFAEARAFAHTYGVHSVLAVPMLKDGQAIGSITLRTLEVRPFTETQTALLRTFADQAVIAFENVRLFKETRAALEQQTAVSDVLKTISQTAFDLQAVFDVVVENATKLCRGVTSATSSGATVTCSG